MLPDTTRVNHPTPASARDLWVAMQAMPRIGSDRFSVIAAAVYADRAMMILAPHDDETARVAGRRH